MKFPFSTQQLVTLVLHVCKEQTNMQGNGKQAQFAYMEKTGLTEPHNRSLKNSLQYCCLQKISILP